MDKREIEFFEKSKQGYKCNGCVSQRRKSILADSVPLTASKVSANGSSSVPITCGFPNEPTTSSSSPISQDLHTSMEQTVTLHMLYSEILKLQKLNTDAITKIECLEESNASLARKVDTLEMKLNLLEQRKKWTSSVYPK